MKRITKAILRQYDIGKWWGGFSNALGNVAVFITIYNMILLTPIAYVTWLSPWLIGLGIKLPFWQFLLFIAICGCIVILVAYKLLTPSSFVFWSSQFWKHENPMKKQLDKIGRTQDKFGKIQENQDKRLGVIEEALKRIEKQNTSH